MVLALQQEHSMRMGNGICMGYSESIRSIRVIACIWMGLLHGGVISGYGELRPKIPLY